MWKFPQFFLIRIFVVWTWANLAFKIMILECCCRNDYFAAHQMLDMHIHIHLISYLLFKTSWTLAICKAFYATWSWGAKSSKPRHISFNIFLPWDFSKTYLNILMLHNYKILCSLIICQCASAFWLGLIIPITNYFPFFKNILKRKIRHTGDNWWGINVTSSVSLIKAISYFPSSFPVAYKAILSSGWRTCSISNLCFQLFNVSPSLRVSPKKILQKTIFEFWMSIISIFKSTFMMIFVNLNLEKKMIIKY